MAPLRYLFGDDADILGRTNFQLLLLATVVSPLGTVLLSPILESLIDPFGATPANIGLMISLYTAPAIVLIPLAGGLADRIGRKPILVAGLVLVGLGGLGIAFTTEFRVILGLRLVQGVGVSGIGPIIVTALGDLYSGAEEATAHGLRQTSAGLIGGGFPILAGILVAVAWQVPFLLYGAALPVAVALVLWFDEPSDRRAGPADSTEDTAYLREIAALVSRPRPLALLSARALANVAAIGFIAYNSVVVVRILGASPAIAGVVFAVQSTTMAIAASQAGRIMLFFDDPLRPLLGSNVVLGAGLLAFAFAPGVLLASVMVAVFGVGYGVTLSLYRSVLTDEAPPELRGGYISLSEAGARIASTVTPVAMGGALAALTPALGEPTALRLTWTAMTAVGAGGGIVCVTIAWLVAGASPGVAEAGDVEPG